MLASMAFEYPPTPEAVASQAMLGGRSSDLPSNRLSDQFSGVDRAYGSGDLNKIAPQGGVGVGTTPWPSAGKTKKGKPFDSAAVEKALSQPRELVKTDPRRLHATQPGITRDGVEYYMGDEYKNTGTTYADRGNVGNRNPVVYNKPDGKRLLLSGHHRAGASLLKGEQFDAIHVFGE